jgi:CDP-glucose 4,6-dehydratase
MENPLGQRLRELPGPVLLTGHTGFKGTWMTFLLENLNIPVIGYSLEAEKNSLFDRTERAGSIPEVFADIRNYEALEKFIDHHKPSTIIHMAAQPLVLKSYEIPHETFEVNVMGTVNLLDIAFKKEFVKAVTVVTTDKVYRNDNSGKAFVESDALEGKDPYSASKVGAEAVITAWQQIEKAYGGPKVVSVRAGNVIGGGDFAAKRLLPDIVRAHMGIEDLVLRNPRAVRPWQHVLDPLTGYLMALESALGKNNFDSFNFSSFENGMTSHEILKIAFEIWPALENSTTILHDTHNLVTLESELLNLNAAKAIKVLKWKPIWSQAEAVHATLKWWDTYLQNNSEIDLAINLDILKILESLNV